MSITKGAVQRTGMKMMKEEVVKSMTFIIHSKNVDIKKQEAIEFKETYDFDILLRRFRMN